MSAIFIHHQSWSTIRHSDKDVSSSYKNTSWSLWYWCINLCAFTPARSAQLPPPPSPPPPPLHKTLSLSLKNHSWQMRTYSLWTQHKTHTLSLSLSLTSQCWQMRTYSLWPLCKTLSLSLSLFLSLSLTHKSVLTDENIQPVNSAQDALSLSLSHTHTRHCWQMRTYSLWTLRKTLSLSLSLSLSHAITVDRWQHTACELCARCSLFLSLSYKSQMTDENNLWIPHKPNEQWGKQNKGSSTKGIEITHMQVVRRGKLWLHWQAAETLKSWTWWSVQLP